MATKKRIAFKKCEKHGCRLVKDDLASFLQGKAVQYCYQCEVELWFVVLAITSMCTQITKPESTKDAK